MRRAPPYWRRPSSAAPVSDTRVKVAGEIVSITMKETSFGDVAKMTVKVTTEAGVWFVWGTLPTFTGDDGGYAYARKGDEVEFVAKLEQGRGDDGRERDESFAFFKRPTKARITKRAAA